MPYSEFYSQPVWPSLEIDVTLRSAKSVHLKPFKERKLKNEDIVNYCIGNLLICS